MLDNGERNLDIINKHTDIVKSLQELDKLDSLEMAQKTNIKWAIEGDENSNRFDKPLDSRLNIDIDFPNILSFEQQTDLEINITQDEIKKAVWDYGVDKYPGPDGSVIVNGSPTNEFQFYRGLKQGDPLSHFLFLLIMESLHISFKEWWMQFLQRFFKKWNLSDATFFNGVEYNGKKQIWVKWNKVLASKDNGGLGVSSFLALNRALLFKWVWHFRTQQSSLWSKVIKGIHGKDGKMGRQVKNMQPSVWDIVREETDKYVIVANKMSHGDMSFSFRRVPRGGLEEFQFMQLLKNMEDVSLIDMKDMWSWSLEGSGEFSVASVRKMLDDRNLPVVSSKTRWINVVPQNADWAECLTTRRSTSGYCVFLRNNLLSWSSKRQPKLDRFSVEAEYRGVANVVAETCWLRNLLRELHTPLLSATRWGQLGRVKNPVVEVQLHLMHVHTFVNSSANCSQLSPTQKLSSASSSLKGNRIITVLLPLTLLKPSAYSFYIPADIHPS
ncbi:RNA-directed DNA polymerase, eukaryota, reverse transcriptase zinc-binding domain protein [Tanacetum coccineum]